MDAIDLMKCADLAARLGKILGVNPVWEDEYVIYRDGSDDDYGDDLIELSFGLENGCWGITTGDYGFINMPKEAPALMAEMSEMIKEENND